MPLIFSGFIGIPSIFLAIVSIMILFVKRIMSRQFEQIPIAIDQLINTICSGWADETISSVAWRKRQEGKWGALL